MKEFVAKWSATKKHETWIEAYAMDDACVLPHSVEVRTALESYPFTKEAFDRLADRRPESLVREGEAILRYLEKQSMVAATE